MLLRRITQHVKDQNWFAVSLDFLIVVVGILIAFQVNGWSERQADKRALDTALVLLRDEINANLETINRNSDLQSDIALAGRNLLQIVRDPQSETVPMDLIGKVFVDGYTTDYSISALNYVLNQDPFQNTENNQLRKAISSLPAKIEDTLDDERVTIRLLDDRWVPYISQYIPVEGFWKDVRDWDFGVSTNRSAEYQTNASLEFKELASTLEFQNKVVNRVGYQALILREQQQLREAFENALVLIEKEIN